jgi:hypothetical protein
MALSRKIVCLVPLLLLSYDGSLQARAIAAERPANSDSAAAIVEKYIEASGGPFLSEIKTELRKGTLVRGASGNVPFECGAKAPDKWYYNQIFAWGDQVSYRFDGSSAWMQDTRGIERMKPDRLMDMRLLMDVRAPLKIRESFPDMTVKGSETVGGRSAVTIAARSREGFSTEFSFDKKTGLLLRAGRILFEDYRTVGKVKRPFKILLGKDEGEAHMQLVMQYSSIEQDVDLDESLFERPSCALQPRDPPLYRPRKQVEVGIEAMDSLVGEYRHPQAAGVLFTVSREKNHLMIHRTGWGQKIEIRPESPTDYYIEFLGIDFHFVKDASGKVTHMEFGDQPLKAARAE